MERALYEVVKWQPSRLGQNIEIIVSLRHQARHLYALSEKAGQVGGWNILTG